MSGTAISVPNVCLSSNFVMMMLQSTSICVRVWWHILKDVSSTLMVLLYLLKGTTAYRSLTFQSELLYDRRFTANQFVLATSPVRLTTSNCIFQLNTCGYNPYVTSSLTRGWVCRLQLLLILASAVILGYEFRGTHYHILLSEIWDFRNLEGQLPALISPRNRMAQLYPQALGSLSVASYDTQGHGGIRTRLQAGLKFPAILLNYL
jgi:hypothetical protein